MSPIRLPQMESIFADRSYSPNVINSLFEGAKTKAGPAGFILSAEDAKSHLLLFVVQNRPYVAAQLMGDQFRTLNLYDYFHALASHNQSILTLYVPDPVLFKSLLIVAQKLPTTTGTADLLNIELLLQQIKSTKKEVVVSLIRVGELNVFYFMSGQLQAAFLANPEWATKDRSAAGQFLKCASSGNPSSPVTVGVYYDVQVKVAEDSDLAWQEWPGGIVEYFLRERPELVFVAGGGSAERERKVITKSLFTIGRNLECDLVIDDDLASRHHADIRESRGKFILTDANSRNGVLVNGKKISTITLSDGDEIEIGDCRILFVEKSHRRAKTAASEELEPTVVKMDERLLQAAAAARAPVSESKGAEQRAHKRIPFFKEVEVEGVGMRRCSDLSVGGMFLETVVGFPVGTVLVLRFKLHDEDMHPMVIQSRVTQGYENVGVGLAFVDLSEENRKRIQKLVDLA